MVNKMKRSKRGFTIIEVLVAAVILTLVFTVVYVIFNASTDFWTRGETRNDAIQNARVFLDLIERDLIAATNYRYPVSINSFQFGSSGDADSLRMIFFDNNSRNWGVSSARYQLGIAGMETNSIYRTYNNTDEPSTIHLPILQSESHEVATGISKLNFEWTENGTTWSTTTKNWPDGAIGLPLAVKVSVTTEAKGLEKEKTFTIVVFIPAAAN